MYAFSNTFEFISLLGTDIFYGCTNLASIVYESKQTETVVLPNTITELGENIFENCQNIEDVYIDTSINNIPKSTFKNCINLSEVFFSNNIQIINESAFENCQSIDVINLPLSLTTLKNNCFNKCSRLEKIYFYSSVNNIDPNAFANCSEMNIPNNSLIIYDNNGYVLSYFTTNKPLVKSLELELDNIFQLYFEKIRNLLGEDYKNLKQYFYPLLDVSLTNNNNIITSQLINNEIPLNLINEYRNFALSFIFETNEPYNSFITNNSNLRIETNINGVSSYNTYIFNEINNPIDLQRNIDITNNLTSFYTRLNEFNKDFFINNYKVRLTSTNNNYLISFSTNDFTTSTQVELSSNEMYTIDNYNIVTGSNNEVIIYKNLQSSPLDFYLKGLELNITSGLSQTIVGEVTEPLQADAYASINIPISLILNTFYYWSDSINVDDVLEEGVKFKTMNYQAWQSIFFTQAIVMDGGISYYKKTIDVIKKQINHDFIRYLALKIFRTANGVDLFRNNQTVLNGLDIASNMAFINKLNYLESLGEFNNIDSSYNISRTILRQILSLQPQRIVPLAGEWTPIPLYAGDKLYIKLFINPNQQQQNIFSNSTINIEPRSYLIQLNLVSG